MKTQTFATILFALQIVCVVAVIKFIAEDPTQSLTLKVFGGLLMLVPVILSSFFIKPKK
jgi:hypothetical protein